MATLDHVAKGCCGSLCHIQHFENLVLFSFVQSADDHISRSDIHSSREHVVFISEGAYNQSVHQRTHSSHDAQAHTWLKAGILRGSF